VLASLRARRDDLGDVIDARQALEVRPAALAARGRTPADLAEIDAALAAMAAEVRAAGATWTATSASTRRSWRPRTHRCSAG
jgi:DNA-binding FadR family transcriptional regulator